MATAASAIIEQARTRVRLKEHVLENVNRFYELVVVYYLYDIKVTLCILTIPQ